MLSVILLAGIFLWPVWARARGKSNKDRRQLAYRIVQECLRLCMYGSLRPEHYPGISQRLKSAAGGSYKKL